MYQLEYKPPTWNQSILCT